MISYSRFTVTATMASTIGPRSLSLHEHHQLTLLVELHPHCGDKLLEIRLEIVLQRGERAKNPFTTARPFSGTNYLEIVRGYCCSSKRVNVPGMIACASRRKQKKTSIHPSLLSHPLLACFLRRARIVKPQNAGVVPRYEVLRR